MSSIKQLNYLLDKKAKIKLLYLLVLIIIGSAAELLGITIILPIIELALDTGDMADNAICGVVMSITGASDKESVLLWLIAFTILVYIIKNLFIFYMHKTQYQYAANIRKGFATRLMTSYLKQPYEYFLSVNSSDLIRSVGSDVDQLFQLINNVLTVISNGITAVTIVVYLSISNFGMTLTVVCVLSICVLIIVLGLQKENTKLGKRNQYYNGQMLKHLRQAFEGVKEIKIMNTERHFIDSYDSTYKEVAYIFVKFSLFTTLPKYLIEVFAIGAILGYLGVNIRFNPNYMELLPQLAVFCVAAYKLLPSVNALYSSFNMIIYYKASIDLVYHDIKEADSFINAFDTVAGDVEPMPFEDAIRMENVSFRYAAADHDVLHGVNIEIPRGKSVALIGPSGGGKTTSADIILNLLDPSEGRVTVDGVDIKTNEWGWKRKIGYIPQSIYLIDDTIRANVAFGLAQDKVDDKEVWRALEDAQLKEFIESLPDGLDTKVGERGVRISGGQRQRIGIARALYLNPEVLVFDEATSALDNETEKEVMKAIDGLQGTKTILMIAHRLSTIEKCDIVYKVENGDIKIERKDS